MLFGSGVAAVVYFTNRQEIPYTHRRHFCLCPVNVERTMGTATFEQIREQAKAEGKLLPPNHPGTLRVKKVGTRIAKTADQPPPDGGYIQHMQGLEWEFAVIASEEVNAFVVPGGKVVVYTGLLRLMDSEDQLANVLAHEAAHVVARHSAERMTQVYLFELVRLLAYWFIGFAPPEGLAAAVFFLPNSRKAETEADTIGLRLAARACYDPAAAAVVFRKLGEMERKRGLDKMPNFIRTHPQTEARIANVKKQLPDAMMVYEANCQQPAARDLLDLFFHPEVVTHDEEFHDQHRI